MGYTNSLYFPGASLVIGNHTPKSLFDLSLWLSEMEMSVSLSNTLFHYSYYLRSFPEAQSSLLQLSLSPFSAISHSHREQTIPSCSAGFHAQKGCWTSLSAVLFKPQHSCFHAVYSHFLFWWFLLLSDFLLCALYVCGISAQSWMPGCHLALSKVSRTRSPQGLIPRHTLAKVLLFCPGTMSLVVLTVHIDPTLSSFCWAGYSPSHNRGTAHFYLNHLPCTCP